MLQGSAETGFCHSLTLKLLFRMEGSQNEKLFFEFLAFYFNGNGGACTWDAFFLYIVAPLC